MRIFLKTAGLLVAGLVLMFLLVFIALPRFNHDPIIPVYTKEFTSTLRIQTSASDIDGAVINGQVKTVDGKVIPAFIRLFNARRTALEMDIVAQSYTDKEGRFTLDAPPGDYEMLVYKGPEFEYFMQELVIPPDSILTLEVSLHRLVNMAERGWFAGDPHQHSLHSDGADDIPSVLLANAAVGLHFSVQTDHNKVEQNFHARDFLNKTTLYSNDSLEFLSVGGDEITTSIGHMNAWEPRTGDGQHIHIDHTAPQHDEPMMAKKKALTRIIGDLKRHALFSQINHPGGGNRAYEQFGEKGGDSFMDVDFDWLENRELILAFDATESWNGGSGFLRSMYHFGSKEIQPFEAYERTFHEWFRLLNTGVKFPSLGSSDTHDIGATKEREMFTELVTGIRGVFWGFLPYMPPKLVYTLTDSVEAGLMYNELDYVEYALEEIALLPGSPRTYVYTGGELTTQALIDNIDHSFISSGPLLFVEVAGAMPGETGLTSGNDTVHIEATSHKPLHKLMVIADGELIHEQSLDNLMRLDETLSLDLSGRKWAIVYLEGNNNYAHAYTNPIYLTGTGAVPQ